MFIVLLDINNQLIPQAKLFQLRYFICFAGLGCSSVRSSMSKSCPRICFLLIELWILFLLCPLFYLFQGQMRCLSILLFFFHFFAGFIESLDDYYFFFLFFHFPNFCQIISHLLLVNFLLMNLFEIHLVFL